MTSWWGRLLALLAPAPAAPAPAPILAPAPAPHIPPIPIPTERNPAMQPGMMLAALRACGVKQPDPWVSLLVNACQLYEINTPRRQAAFLANVVHESAGLTTYKESLYYSKPERLVEVWPSRFPTVAAALPYVRNPEALAEKVYGGRMGNRVGSGDALRYLGRGLIQCTGADNYAEMAAACGVALEKLPEWMETREGAALSAAAWWNLNGLNVLADTGTVAQVRRRVNGGTVGLAEVEKHFAAALKVLTSG